MNERIRELAIQVQRTEMPGVLFAHPEFVEKFAELIVAECMKVVSNGKYSVDECRYNTHRIAHNNARCEASLDIKKHFGV